MNGDGGVLAMAVKELAKGYAIHRPCPMKGSTTGDLHCMFIFFGMSYLIQGSHPGGVIYFDRQQKSTSFQIPSGMW
jgi:hypothetical protein